MDDSASVISSPGSLGTLEAVAVLAAGLFLLVVLWWAIGRVAAGSWRLLGHRTVRGGARYASARIEPWRVRAKTRFPRAYRLVAPRLDTSHVSGLPLTLLVAAAGYLAVLFAGLIEELFEAREIAAADSFVFDLVAPLRVEPLVAVFTWITDLGSMPTLTAAGIVATGFLWARGPKSYIAPAWLCVVGSQATTWSGKFLIDRSRPEFLLDVVAYSPSFPSGHATGAMAVYGILAYAVSRDLPNVRRRYDVAYWTGVIILLVALSRIFLGVHFASDVAAGLLVGAFWVLAGIALAEVTRSRGLVDDGRDGLADGSPPT